MTSLRDLQSAFASAVRSGDARLIAPYVVAGGIPPERRVGIYANNVRENFLATLEATFPVLARLAGRDWLRQVGTAYLRACPSRAGNLHYVGERFATFLELELAETPYAYFSDVARLEWAYQEVLVAAEPGDLDLAALAAVPADAHDRIVFDLSPAARLVESVYPLLAIWRANRTECGSDDAAESAIRLDAGASRLLIHRRQDHVELRELPAGEFALLVAFAAGRGLGEAAACALQADATFDLPAALSRLLQLGAFAHWRLRRSSRVQTHLAPESTP